MSYGNQVTRSNYANISSSCVSELRDEESSSDEQTYTKEPTIMYHVNQATDFGHTRHVMFTNGLRASRHTCVRPLAPRLKLILKFFSLRCASTKHNKSTSFLTRCNLKSPLISNYIFAL